MTKFSKNHPVWTGIIGLVLLVIIVGALAGGSSDKSTTPTTSAAATSANTAPAQTTPVNPDEDSQPGNLADDESADTDSVTTEDAAPDMTAGQENALQSAHDYIDLQGFSKKGLIDQLHSEAGEGFSLRDATFAANQVGADWKQEAVESAREYLDSGSFSKAGLIEQLSSSAGEQFTQAQASYAVNKVYR